MTRPTTAPGRALAEAIFRRGSKLYDDAYADGASDALDRVKDAVEAVPEPSRYDFTAAYGHGHNDAIKAVLRAIEAARVPE